MEVAGLTSAAISSSREAPPHALRRSRIRYNGAPGMVGFAITNRDLSDNPHCRKPAIAVAVAELQLDWSSRVCARVDLLDQRERQRTPELVFVRRRSRLGCHIAAFTGKADDGQLPRLAFGWATRSVMRARGVGELTLRRRPRCLGRRRRGRPPSSVVCVAGARRDI